MKKFTLMIVAALMAVTASAQKLERAQLTRPMQDRVSMTANPMQSKVNRVARPMQGKTQSVETIKQLKKARNAASVSSIDDLTGTWMQIYYSYFDETILSTVMEITKTEGSENSITINGWWGSWTEPIEAKVDLAAGTITIDPQLIYEYEGDEPAELINATTEGAALIGTIEEDGSITFEDEWAAAIIGGEQSYEYALFTMLVRPNGKMNYMNSSSGKKSIDVYIEQDIEEEKVYVYNFGNYGQTIELNINSDKTFEVPSDQFLFYYDEELGDCYLYGLNETATGLVNHITATGTENTITFDQTWTAYSYSGYIVGGQNTGCTITLTDGSTFVYPAEIEDVAATPATPTGLEYNVHPTYGPRIFVEVPREDVDGNKLRKDKLFYQIYYMKDDTAFPYTLLASAYEELDSDMDLIPYSFTDDWDIFTDGDSKRVYLYPAEGEVWEKVGVQAVYTGGGETRVSGIIWYNIADGTITVEEDTTGISLVNATLQNGGKAYNLAGQQVKQGYKGVVIKDGKKFVIK